MAMWFAFVLAVLFCLCSEQVKGDKCVDDADVVGGYSQPSWWCDDPLCAVARDESPIDVNLQDVIDGGELCSGELYWLGDWTHSQWQVENTCHSLQITPMRLDSAGNLQDSTDASETPVRLYTYGTPFESEYDEYCLVQFHFHWGEDSSVGSEHTLGGTRFPLELHLVHYACEYDTYDAAKDHGIETTEDNIPGVDHSLAVIAFWFEIEEDDNPAFDVVLSDDVVKEVFNCIGGTNPTQMEHSILEDLIPGGYFSGGYYSYKGSLTTPPCTDDVNWFIMKTRIGISEQQIEKFRKMRDENTDLITRNWRSTQDNHRGVTDCEYSSSSDTSGDSSSSEPDTSDTLTHHPNKE